MLLLQLLDCCCGQVPFSLSAAWTNFECLKLLLAAALGVLRPPRRMLSCDLGPGGPSTTSSDVIHGCKGRAEQGTLGAQKCLWMWTWYCWRLWYSAWQTRHCMWSGVATLWSMVDWSTLHLPLFIDCLTCCTTHALLANTLSQKGQTLETIAKSMWICHMSCGHSFVFFSCVIEAVYLWHMKTGIWFHLQRSLSIQTGVAWVHFLTKHNVLHWGLVVCLSHSSVCNQIYRRHLAFPRHATAVWDRVAMTHITKSSHQTLWDTWYHHITVQSMGCMCMECCVHTLHKAWTNTSRECLCHWAYFGRTAIHELSAWWWVGQL